MGTLCPGGAQDADGCASSRSRRSWRRGPIGDNDMFPLFTTSSAVRAAIARGSLAPRLSPVPSNLAMHFTHDGPHDIETSTSDSRASAPVARGYVSLELSTADKPVPTYAAELIRCARMYSGASLIHPGNDSPSFPCWVRVTFPAKWRSSRHMKRSLSCERTIRMFRRRNASRPVTRSRRFARSLSDASGMRRSTSEWHVLDNRDEKSLPLAVEAAFVRAAQ
jgi:hypothetical protein